MGELYTNQLHFATDCGRVSSESQLTRRIDMRYRTHTRRRRLSRQLIPTISDLELKLTESDILVDLGFAYTRIPSGRKVGE
jgi:hypothetical protein